MKIRDREKSCGSHLRQQLRSHLVRYYFRVSFAKSPHYPEFKRLFAGFALHFPTMEKANTGAGTMLRRQRHNEPSTATEAEETLPLHRPPNAVGENDIPPTNKPSTIHAPMSVSVRRHWMALLHRRWYLTYPLILFGAIACVLIFGTLYSDLTARDPCAVLEESKRSDGGSAPPTLPRLFHYQSKTDALTEETKSWRKALGIAKESLTYPGVDIAKLPDSEWTSVYWSDNACRSLVEDYFQDFADTYDNFPHTIQRVDSCRYLILSKYGGVYADTDISLHTSNAKELEELIPDGVGLVESPYRYNEIWQNSLMTATAPGHPFWNVAVEIMKERKGSNIVLSTTGPKMIGDAVERYRSKNDKKEVEDVHTLPCELFQRLPSGEWDTTFLNVLGRDVLARAIPMRGCGRYGDGRCEITRHAGKASWTKDAGLV